MPDSQVIDAGSRSRVHARRGTVRGGIGSPAPREAAPVRRGRPPRSGAIAWQLSGALLLVLAVATAGLHVLFADQSWWLLVVFVMALVLASAATARALWRARILPTVVSAAVLVAAMTLFFASSSSLFGVIPTFGTIDQFGQLLAQANDSIYRQAVPADADTAIVFSLAFGLGAIAVICDLLALTFRLPAVTGVFVLGILAVPAFTLSDISDPIVFVLTVASFLFLLVLGAPRRQPGLAAGIGATALIGTLVLPVVLPTIDTSIASNSGGPSSGINPVLNLGNDLRRASARTVLTYSTVSGTPHYLRLVSLDDFTGDEWAPTERAIDENNSVDEFGPIPGLAEEVPTTQETTSIEVQNLTSRWLPVPYPTRSITGLESDWYWDADGLSVSSPNDTPRNQEYEVESVILQPSPEQLLAAGTTVTDRLDPYLALPENLPPVIPLTATTVAGGAATNYEKALALQEYFRSPEFTYSEDAPVEGDYDGTGMDLIAEFLDAKAGYCVHFASSMAVMARSLGIPSRVIVGFLPGTPEEGDAGTTFEVNTHDLHSWPELYFDGIGWVQFEPTPGRGELGDYADVTNAGVPAPQPAVDPGQQATPSVAPSPTSSVAPDNARDSGGGTNQQSSSVGSAPWIALGVIGALVLLLVPAFIRQAQRRRLRMLLRSREATALDAWREVLRSAIDLHCEVLPTETPRETVRTLGIGGAPLARILAATEEKGYAATTLTDPKTLEQDVDDVRRALFEVSPTRTRLLRILFPASIWRRIVAPFAPSELSSNERVGT